MGQKGLKPQQRAVLESAMEPGNNRTIVAVCEAAGVPHSTFYRWLGDPEFAEAWEQVWYGSVKRHLPGVVAAMVKAAQSGDVSAGRLVAEMAGVLKQKHEHAGKDGGPLVFQFDINALSHDRDSDT